MSFTNEVHTAGEEGVTQNVVWEVAWILDKIQTWWGGEFQSKMLWSSFVRVPRYHWASSATASSIPSSSGTTRSGMGPGTGSWGLTSQNSFLHKGFTITQSNQSHHPIITYSSLSSTQTEAHASYYFHRK